MRGFFLLVSILTLVISGCAGMGGMGTAGGSGGGKVSGLEVVAESNRQWTGVAVSQEGRMFVCYPRWSDDAGVSVAEILPTGEAVPYPDEQWNEWEKGLSPKGHFVCVQSVYVDADNYLWILDPANPRFKGVVYGGPKLIRVDLARNKVTGKYYFDEYAAPGDSYLNDVRVDTVGGYAYITDSGLGAIIELNLANSKSRRLLEFDTCTKSEGITVTIDGKPWLRPNGKKPEVHADGVALSPDGEYLYFKALTASVLYRVRTDLLRNVLMPSKRLAASIEPLVEAGPSDGMMFGPDGGLYITDIEAGAIKRLTPEGILETVIKDRRLVWPDSFSLGPDNTMFVTTSQINLLGDVKDPYRVLRFKVAVPEKEEEPAAEPAAEQAAPEAQPAAPALPGM